MKWSLQYQPGRATRSRSYDHRTGRRFDDRTITAVNLESITEDELDNGFRARRDGAWYFGTLQAGLALCVEPDIPFKGRCRLEEANGVHGCLRAR
jgi:hypothetical protein